jgi:SAM-dependent methyltransferase
MPYPSQDASQKHDLVVPRDLVHPLRSGSFYVTTTAQLLETLEKPIPKDSKLLCVVCSYPDAPTPPLSRALYVVAVCQPSLVESLYEHTTASTLAVRRADGPHHNKLDAKHQINSPRFQEFMASIYEEQLVAILGRDKYQRFGILLAEGSSSQDKLSYCATCHVGQHQTIVKHLTSVAKTPAKTTEWVPTTPPMDNDDWQPTTPPMDEPPQDSMDTGWKPATPTTNNGDNDDNMWKPPDSTEDQDTMMWQPPTSNETSTNNEGFDSWQPETTDDIHGHGHKRKAEDATNATFHQDSGAAAADAFYSGLTRSLDTRSESRLFHMRAFNGWVKATQIQELAPKTGSGPLRILDLACGKGGDLGKWVLHTRGIRNYVGVDVARGSLRDAALRARKMRSKLPRATFTVADLGSDVPGRLRTQSSAQMQPLLTWSLQNEPVQTTQEPQFERVRGGGISQEDKFDIVSIQFAIHYMFSSRDRARRFFQTVSELLEIGGNLIATTIDARIVLDKLMGLGLDLHNYDEQRNDGALVKVGGGVCRIQFTPEKTKQIFQAAQKSNGKFDAEDLFGLEYTFTLVEGSDHGAGVGDAVNLPEWLNPIPVLKSLAAEAGLELESAENFHEFFANRKDPSKWATAHHALYNMKVLDRNGSIPPDNWEVSRLYCALKFTKVRESTMVLDEADEPEEPDEAPPPAKVARVESATDKKMLPMAMMQAKKVAGDRWNTLDAEDKKALIEIELENLTW